MHARPLAVDYSAEKCIHPFMGTNTEADRYERMAPLRDALLEVQNALSLAQLVALVTIAMEPGLSVNDLAERLRIPQQSASRYVAALAGRYQPLLAESSLDPLIVQTINESDPRKRALFLTPAGRQLMSSMSSAVAETKE
ncbi:MarR family transcriptional regulator [Sphingomonas crusticola]|uniref:MarR family winged helix-turn-helix transcriptional regulator n=1 Tax=Sphingomonas crusticola TaxID=1697973 RepID=UPI000E285D8C